jgi:Bacterial regulatory helix-turn-helix protein, lysR family
MNIVDLESFVTVAESGSIVDAAAKLHLTQSAITSTHIRISIPLERLNVLDRTVRSFTR